MTSHRPLRLLLSLLLAVPGLAPAQSSPAPQKIIFDTDIGDDIDDVLALGLVLQSPDAQLLAITTAWGDTSLRARLVDRLLRETGHTGIPVGVGPEVHGKGEGTFSQADWAKRQPAAAHPDAVALILDLIRRNPGEITLLAVAPLTNLAAAIDRDPVTFRKLRRIVLMGGSVDRGYSEFVDTPTHGPDPEYNLAMSPSAAQRVFTSGVPLYLMPLDSTQIKLDELRRQLLFTASTPLTDAITLLYHQWSRSTRIVTPTMFDAVAAAFAIDPAQCPATPMRLEVNSRGMTRRAPGTPNIFVCLHSDTDGFFRFYLPRLVLPSPSTASAPKHAP